MTNTNSGQGCLSGFMGFILFLTWSSALTIYFISNLISPPSIKKFMKISLQTGVTNQLEMSDEEFYKKTMSAAERFPEQSIKVIPREIIQVDAAKILKTGSADELYLLIADEIVDPLYSKDSKSILQLSKDYDFLRGISEAEEFTKAWGDKNLYSLHKAINRSSYFMIVLSVVFAGLMIMFSGSKAKLRAPGILAFIIAIPWFIADMAIKKGGWLKDIEYFTDPKGKIFLPGFQAVFHDATLLSRISFWGGIALIIVSIVLQIQSKSENSYSENNSGL